MSGDPLVLRDEPRPDWLIHLSNDIARIVIEQMDDHIIFSKRYGFADAVLAHPRVAAALRVLEAVEGAEVELTTTHGIVRLDGFSAEGAIPLLDRLRAVAVEQ